MTAFRLRGVYLEELGGVIISIHLLKWNVLVVIPPLAGMVNDLMLLSPRTPTSNLFTTVCSCHRPCNRLPKQGLAWTLGVPHVIFISPYTPKQFFHVCNWLFVHLYCYDHAIRFQVSAFMYWRPYVLKLVFRYPSTFHIPIP
jgi:hypothetical protein